MPPGADSEPPTSPCRPASLLLPHSYHTDPSGTYVKYKCMAIGSGSEGAQTALQEQYKEDLSLADAEVLALSILKQVMEEKVRQGAAGCKSTGLGHRCPSWWVRGQGAGTTGDGQGRSSTFEWRVARGCSTFGCLRCAAHMQTVCIR